MTTTLEPGGFVNRMPRYEILSDDAMATIERGWRRLISEVGIRFDHQGAQRLFREAGQRVDDEGVVRLDPDFVLEHIALAPASFELRARNPRRSVTIGGDHMVFSNVGGPPSYSRTACAATRCSTTSSASSSSRTSTTRSIRRAGIRASASDLPLDSRHLDTQFATLTLSDKPHMGALFTGAKARDGIEMAAIAFGGRAELSADLSCTGSRT